MLRQYPESLRSSSIPASDLLDDTYSLENIPYEALMFQTGYYTVKAETRDGEFVLDYPNEEVRRTYTQALWREYAGGKRFPGHSVLAQLYASLQDRDYAAFCLLLETLLADMPGEKMTAESDYHIVLHVLCQALQIEFASERHVWGGRPDLVVQFQDHVCLFELKHDRTAQEALQQIETKGYFKAYRLPHIPEIVCVGLNVRKQDTTVEWDTFTRSAPWIPDTEQGT